METGIAVATISAAASLIGAALSFVFSKRNEREGEWRKIKFEHYREFMTALSGIAGSEVTTERYQRFAQACNTVHLVASKQAIEVLHALQDEITIENRQPIPGKSMALASALVRAFRADLGISLVDNPPELTVRLWVPPTEGTPR